MNTEDIDVIMTLNAERLRLDDAQLMTLEEMMVHETNDRAEQWEYEHEGYGL